MPARPAQPSEPPRRHGVHDRAYWRAALAEAARLGEGGLPLSRRAFLQALTASAALAGLGGCFSEPEEPIFPYTRRPEDVLPGVPRAYATSFERQGYGVGVLVESHEGRPVKVEGNPDHPASLGAAGVFEQALLLSLYDPDRLKEPRRRGAPARFDRLVREVQEAARRTPDLAGTRVLLEPTASPLVRALLERLAQARPGLRVHFHAPLHEAAPREVSRRLFGRVLEILPRFEQAEVVLALDDDFLAQGPSCLRFARDFAERRRILARGGAMNRLYTVGPLPSSTTGMADHHLSRRAEELPAVAAALARAVAERTGGASQDLRNVLAPLAAGAQEDEAIAVLADDLVARRGRALVTAGARQPEAVHALAHLLNDLLGAYGGTLGLVPSPLRAADAPEERLPPLVEAMRAGEVRRLFVLHANPAYDAPAPLEFASAMERVEHVAVLSLLLDETAARAEWVLPELTALEAWEDTAARDGTAALVQPPIAPLHGGHTRAELLALLAGEPLRPPYERLREHWQDLGEQDWRQALERGVIEGSAAQPVSARPDRGALLALLRESAQSPEAAATPPLRETRDAQAEPAATGQERERPDEARVELAFAADPSVLDGRFANNPWLQELPDPITKLTWDNAAWIAPALAERLGVGDGAWLRLRRGGRELALPALVVPGVADGSIGLFFGYGRTAPALSVARDAGFDVYPLWGGEAAAPGHVSPAPDRPPYPLARTQTHFELHDRAHEVLRQRTLEEYRTHEPTPHPKASFYHAPYEGSPQWGMAIDLTVCTGCSACVVACQAENNVPVVGKQGVREGREMHWLRIDRYALGEGPEPRHTPQPMLCQHCEMAPCEYVCPVYATLHSEDGLNEMIYNRCVGTRFCSNNCPYKVRRFNWFEYNGDVPPEHAMQHNPEVTVRARGVMEKCTYCVQRIRRAQIEAGREDRTLRDGEVRTACQEACPTRAIRFGDLTDPDAEVARLLAAPQTYAVLGELGTQPRTRYLARITNPNPAFPRASSEPRSEEAPPRAPHELPAADVAAAGSGAGAGGEGS